LRVIYDELHSLGHIVSPELTSCLFFIADNFASSVVCDAKMLAESRRGKGADIREEDVRDILSLVHNIEDVR